MSCMIVVDGRTDEEKLRELLAAGTEQVALDFKATLDLSQKTSADVLHLVKDCVAMGNLPSGGYIVVGVDDAGAPAHDQAPVEVKRFDSADLRARVARYTDAQVHLVAQPHVVDGRDMVLIYEASNPDGLPVPFSAIGQYQDTTRRCRRSLPRARWWFARAPRT
jgi:predicted HTH transcriptional regulator